MMKTQSSPLFPEITPFATHMLPVDNGHTLYVEESGNPSGLPVLVLHGGPGSGCNDKSRRRFDPSLYQIICFDQRGAGRSTPFGKLEANTTPDLVADIETLRKYLNLETMVLYGTSWGSTLALAYAQAHAERVIGLVIGGIFLGTAGEAEWFSNPSGLPLFRWPQYQAIQSLFAEPVTGTAFFNNLLALLTGADETLARRAAEAFLMYEGAACDPNPDLKLLMDDMAADEHLTTHAAIEVHYFAHHCFLTQNQLIQGCSKILDIPTHILQGELDLVCPPAMAQALHAALPNSKLTLVPMCGHRANDAMEAARCEATTAMAKKLSK